MPQEVKIDAIVISNAKKREYYNTYIIKGKNSIYKNNKFILNTRKELDFGDKINLKGEFYQPAEARNYKGFNYKKYLQSNKIYGTIKTNNIDILSKDNVNIFLSLSNNVRNKVINNINNMLPKNTSSLLIGILLRR